MGKKLPDIWVLCPVCKKEVPRLEYRPLQDKCRRCYENAWRVEWKKKNRTAYLAKLKRHYAGSRKRILAQRAAFYQRHKERLLAKRSARYWAKRRKELMRRLCVVLKNKSSL